MLESLKLRNRSKTDDKDKSIAAKQKDAAHNVVSYINMKEAGHNIYGYGYLFCQVDKCNLDII